MTIINANTKRGQNFIQSAYYYEGRTLADVYASPSHAKQSAFDECRALCYAEGGGELPHYLSQHVCVFGCVGCCRRSARGNGAGLLFCPRCGLRGGAPMLLIYIFLYFCLQVMTFED